MKTCEAKQPIQRSVVSLFTGAGGLDIGLERAGFVHRLCVEIDPDARRTVISNKPTWPFSSQHDLLKLSGSQLLKQAGLRPRELTLLAGGPPCAPFSKAAYWVRGGTDRLKDPRAKTLRAYLRIVEATLPHVLLLENVKGIAYRNKDEGLRLLSRGLAKINRGYGTQYRPIALHIDAASFGVPQHRERVFVIASRDGATFNPPRTTHSANTASLLPFVTTWDAIGEFDQGEWPDELAPRGKWAELLPTIPEGHNYLWHSPQGGGAPLFGWRTRYWSFLLKLRRDAPAWTVPATPGPATGPFHWRGRLLSIRELCRLQTFPDDYVIYGNRISAHRQVGNAVPCAVGELLGLEIRRQLLRETIDCKLTLLPTKQRRTFSALATASIPPHYLRLVADHPPHPGVGRGPGAILRSKKPHQGNVKKANHRATSPVRRTLRAMRRAKRTAS